MSRERELLTEIHSRAVLLSQTVRTPAIVPIVKQIVLDSERALEIEAEGHPEPARPPRLHD